MEFDIFSNLLKERILFLHQEIDAETATKLSASLIWLNSQDSQKQITLYINSDGGSVDDGLFVIYDVMQNISAPISTICLGRAFSSAAVLLTAGTKGLRFAFPNSKMMIHSIQTSFSGETPLNQSEIEEETKAVKKLNLIMMSMLASHTGNKLSKIKKDCKGDKYFSVEEAIKYGLIDAILQPIKEIPNII